MQDVQFMQQVNPYIVDKVEDKQIQEDKAHRNNLTHGDKI